jgi:hypothetical protein
VLVNNGPGDILIVSSNPRHPANTSYFLAMDAKTKEVQIKRLLYAYPSYLLIEAEPQCFALTRVRKGEIYKEVVSVTYPRSQNYLAIPETIDFTSISSLRFRLGILPFDDSINDVPLRKPFGRCVDGQEGIGTGAYKGKNLIEIQRVLSTKALSSETWLAKGG